MNYYQLLELNQKATRDEITQAYNRKKELLTGQSLSDVKRAYLILLDPKERIRYDTQLLKDTNSFTQSSNTQAHHVEIETPSLLTLEELESQNYYERLSVGTNENAMTIKKAYAQAARLYSNEQYPDHFVLIREAFETLFDAEKREDYDAYLDEFDTGDDYGNAESYHRHSSDATTSNTQSSQSTYTPTNSTSSGSSRAVWGWIVAILGSFIFTPVLAIPLGMVIGMGFSGAFMFVVRFFSTIITIVIIIFLFMLIFG